MPALAYSSEMTYLGQTGPPTVYDGSMDATSLLEPQTQTEILTPEAGNFLRKLANTFEPERQRLLARRRVVQQEIDGGKFPNFLPETAAIRAADWRVAPIPRGLQDRRVEITGPVERKMIINGLNAGANVFMADFEDSNSPTWKNNLEGQRNLFDAVRGIIRYVSPEGKRYELKENPSALMVRPRSWHLEEKHFLVNGEPISASLFDFGLFFFHNAAALLEKGSGPYFYLPKIESHLEARLWNDVFCFAQDELGIARGSIRATVLIETILAAFEMDEILFELRAHSAGLNCGRWDYIFSFIKKFRAHPEFVLPDRSSITMERHFLSSYVELLIQTCHRRGTHAMGGMAAQIPIRNDAEANERAFAKVKADKLREVHAGHDGTWVAHPGLVAAAKEVFDTYMPEANQISRKRDSRAIQAADLLKVSAGDITEEGLRWNIDVGLQYLDSWLQGSGCVPIYNLMEDAATAEISRAQVWQWVRHGATLNDGQLVTAALVCQIIEERTAQLGEGVCRSSAAKLMTDLVTAKEFPEFLTLAGSGLLD
ncbi:MAG TPA: malate synthase A [Terriglobales bacterium]|nr:malate synthase A [Terriglobales bacterium]